MAHWQRVPPGRILDVDYAALVRQPEAVMRKVTAFVAGLRASDARHRQQPARRVHRQRGVGATGHRGTHHPKWAPYAAQLQPLADALGRRDPV
jgi:hypothetical protein